jgi:hypothetical protein
MTADMARQLPRVAMVGERHTAVRALANVAAGLTDHGRGKSSAIQEENTLLTIGKALLDGLQERRRTDGIGPARTRRPAQVEHSNQRHSAVVNALRESEQSVFSGGTIVPTFHGRSRAAENHRAVLQLRPQNGDVTSVIPRSLFLFVGALMLLVDDDDAKVLKRGKDGTSRSDDNARAARMNFPPFIEAFASREMAMENGNFPLRIRKARLEPFDSLRRKRNFGNEDKSSAPEVKNMPNRLQIDFRLPTASHPEE